MIRIRVASDLHQDIAADRRKSGFGSMDWHCNWITMDS